MTFLRKVTLALGLLDVGIGTALALSGPGRVSSPSYDTAKVYATVQRWGLLLALLGGLLLAAWLLAPRVPPRTGDRVRRWALALAAAWCAFYGMAFANSAVTSSMASAAAPLIYAGLTALHVLAAWED